MEAEATEESSSLNDPKVNPSSVSDPGESNVRQSILVQRNPLKPWLAEATRIVFSDDARLPNRCVRFSHGSILGRARSGRRETLQEHRIARLECSWAGGRTSDGVR